MSVYNIIAQQQITTPFIQFFNGQEKISQQINFIFVSNLKNQQNFYKRINNDFTKFSDIIDSNSIIFNERKIILFNFVELLFHKTNEIPELIIRFLHPANKEYLFIITTINDYYSQLLQIMREWNILYDKFNGIEFITPINQIQILKEKILTGKCENVNYTLLPFNEHYKKYLKDIFDSLEKNISNFNLFIKFDSTEINNTFKFEIYSLLKDNYFEPENLNLLISGERKKSDIDTFLKDLFIYGKI